MKNESVKKNSNNKMTAFIVIGSLLIVLLLVIIACMPRIEKIHHHSFETELAREASCSESGLQINRCTECGYEYKEELPLTGHTITDDGDGDGKIHTGTCQECGEEVLIMYNKDTGVRFSAPFNTRGKTATAIVTNSRGHTYKYVMYLQGGGYDCYSRYMKHHGCSTCAMTSLLNAMVPGLENYTPDRVVDEIEPAVFGERTFNRNYKSDRENGSMPVTLYGMTKIFDKYGVRYELPTADTSGYEDEITKHLENGDPVIITFARGGAGGLSNSIHTILLLGIDSDGYVIIGDSLHKKSKNWGKSGLVKTGKITVSDMVSYITTYGNWSVSSDVFDSGGNIFYRTKADRGYLLVYGDIHRKGH